MTLIKLLEELNALFDIGFTLEVGDDGWSIIGCDYPPAPYSQIGYTAKDRGASIERVFYGNIQRDDNTGAWIDNISQVVERIKKDNEVIRKYKKTNT